MKNILFVFAAMLILVSCKPDQNFTHLYNAKGWEEMKTPKNVNLYKVFPQKGGILASGYGDGVVYEAKNNTWSKFASLAPEYVEQVQFVNDNIAYACGDYGFVYKSTDGGKKWQEVGPQIYDRIVQRFREVKGANQYPVGLFIMYTDLYFADPMTGYISGKMYKPNVGYNKSIEALNYWTKDGGKNWTFMTPEAAAKKQAEIRKTAQLTNTALGDKYATYHLDNNHAWMSYYDKKFDFQVGRSSDGGKTWAYSPRPKSKHGEWSESSKVFVSPKNGFLFGGTVDGKKGVGFYTLDGGETWKEIQANWPYINDAGIFNGQIYMSTKGGKVIRSKVG